jgi:NADPH-ferrihemoprotein reductase
MVGPGTGFAPFRGFLQHRKWQKDEGRDVGDTILFTGCRNRSIDYIYSEELENFEKNKILTKNFVAFSRDSEKKVYVQHLLKEQKEIVWDVINRNGSIYVCGDAKNMARDVNDVIVEIISEFKKVEKQSAIDFVKSKIYD